MVYSPVAYFDSWHLHPFGVLALESMFLLSLFTRLNSPWKPTAENLREQPTTIPNNSQNSTVMTSTSHINMQRLNNLFSLGHYIGFTW